MRGSHRQQSESRNWWKIVAATLFVLCIVLVGAIAALYANSERDRLPGEQSIAGTDPTPVPTSDHALQTNEEDAPDGVEGAGWIAVNVEHCQLSIRYPGHWRHGVNEYGADYLANYPTDSEPPAYGVIVELCPLREGNMETAGERFEFPGGFTGSIFRGGIYEIGVPEKDIDLLYQGNRFSWFLSASFEAPATDENPATAEFFSIIDTIEHFDSGMYVHEPPAEAVDEGPIIDPLFITYACSYRDDPTYNMALETWGYLTHGGREVICLEFRNGNYDFVAHHQALIESEGPEIVHRFTGRDDNPGARWVHDQNPEQFFVHAVASGGVRTGGPFGQFLLSRMNYEKFDLLFQAHSEATQMLSIAELEYWIRDWAEREGRSPFGYSHPGEVLAPTLTGSKDTHLARRLDAVYSAEAQYLMIYGVLEGLLSHYATELHQQMILQAYDRLYSNYWSSFEASLWFHEWLIENHDVFLSYYWPNEDWTPNRNE
jgi:hypothetical protein